MNLVTGINGFLGRHVAELLRNEGKECIGLVRNNSGDQPDGHYTSIEAVLLAGHSVSTIYHLAAYIPYGIVSGYDEELYASNIRLTCQLRDAFPNARIVLASSVSVYGSAAELPLTIRSPFNQPGHYGLSKLAAESIVHSHHSYAIIRFSSIIGVGMKPVSMVPKMIQNAKANGELVVFGDGSRLQNYIDVRDAAALCLVCGGLTENLTILGVGKESFSNMEMAGMIARHTGARLQLTGIDASPSFIYDAEDAFDSIGYSHEYSLENTIRDMIANT